MITVSSFMYRNGITWENLLWGSSIILGCVAVWTAGIMYQARLSAKASVIKNELPAMVEERVGEIISENKDLLESKKQLVKENQNLRDDLSIFDALYEKRKGEE